MGTTGSSEIVSFLSGPQRRTLPLLPFERELIDTLGCSPEEYRRFTEEALWRAQRRPAAYDGIPDVQNGFVVPLLINLAIGIALSAVSALLAPKPKEATQIQQRKLKNSNQANRFNSTYGFDSISELAEYGQRIAIPFGRYGAYGDRTTGGLVLGPALVWSRMFSYGKSQGIKALFAVGETLQCQPDLAGIFLGNSPLDAVFKESFAVYWSRGEGRIHAKHLLYGSRGRRDSGDPQTSDDAFLCPTAEGSDEPGFSCAYTPSNNTSFGVYGAIPNGTAYRVNWRVVSCPSIKDADDDPQGTLRYERRKIAGKECDGTDGRGGEPGMPGLGRGYGRHMGLVGHNGTFMTAPTRVTVAVGHKVQFRIFAYELDLDRADIETSSGVEVEDINNAIQDECIAADDAMQVGETFLIGRTLWKVINRPDETFRRLRSRKKTEPLDYILECTELLGGVNEIGIAGGKAVNAAIVSEGLTFKAEDGWLGPSYYPLLKVDLGVVRNVRRTDATEIGIRSQVWNRANGMCNFSVVPTPEKLIKLDKDSVNLSGGTMSRYFDRTSAFTIFLRPAGLQPDGTEYPWVALGEQFCVTGNRPVDKYNYIRIKARIPGRYEYRIIPKCGADVRQYTPETEAFWELDATSSTILGADYSTAYGEFRVTTTGREVAAGDLLANRELQTRSGQSATGEWKTQPQSVTRLEWLPSSVTVGRHAGYMTEFLGEADASPKRTVTGTKTVTVGTKTVTLKITGYSESIVDTQNWAYYTKWNRWHYWIEQKVEVVSATGGWKQDEQFEHIFPANGFVSVPFGCRYQVSGVGVTYIPPNPYSSQRIFESTSRIADISHYSELEKSNASNAEHEIVYVNESVSNASIPNYDSMTMLGLALKSGRSYQQLDQIRAWVPDGVPVYRCLDGSTGPSNLFCDLAYHLLTDKVMGLGATVSSDLIKVEDMKLTAKFLAANRIHFDGVLADVSNVRSLLVDLAPLNLCNFVIAGGQFSVVPALPCNDDGTFNTGAVQVQAIFTGGNIIDGTFQLDYLNAEERRDIKAVASYMQSSRNNLKAQRTVTVKWNEPAADTHPQETFDMTLFCTNRDQAVLVSKYMLSLRRRITHMVKFKTTPYGLNLAPGQLIRVDTEISPYSSTLNGVVGLNGAVLSATPLVDGTYQVLAYKQGSDQVETVSMTITNGEVADPAQMGMLFTRQATVRERNVYLVEELTLDEDGLVEVSASHFPTDNDLKSTILADMLSTSAFEVLD